MSYPQTLAIITYITLTASNYIVVDQFEPLINEYRCSPHQSCTISCLSTVSCAGSSLYCPVDHDCNIICDPRNNDGANACFNTIIHAENAKSLSVTVTAYESNAQSMTIYTPYPDINNDKKSVLTCYSGGNNLNQCKGIKIYAIRGFNDIELKCNDDTSLCDISGSIKCGYNQYNHDECQSFQYKNNQIGYQCLSDTFCSDNTAMPTTNNPSISPTSKPSISPSKSTTKSPTTTTPTKSSSKSSTPSPTNPESSNKPKLIFKTPPSTINNPSESPTISPTAIPTVSVVKQEVITMSASEQEPEIHSLYIVIAGTLTISCVIFITLAICGILYVRLNRENVEQKIIKRYAAGRGLSISSQRMKRNEDTDSNDSHNNDTMSNNDTSTSNDRSNLSSSTYITDNGSEDSNDLGLTATYPMGGNTTNTMEMEIEIDDDDGDDEYDEFDDELDDLQNSGDDIDDINIITNPSKIQCITSQSSHSGAMFGELQQSVSHRNTETLNSKLNDKLNVNNKYEIEMAEIQNNRAVAISPEMSNDNEIRDGYIDNIITTNSENTIQIENDHSINNNEQIYYFTESDDTENNDELKNEEEYITTNTLPPPPPKLFELNNINDNDTDHLTEKQKQILLENIRNKARCFGYCQSEILYEEDENYSDDTDECEDEDVGEIKKVDINIINKYNNNLKLEQEHNDIGSDTDDLLEEGEIINTHHNHNNIGIEIKIDLINNNNNNDDGDNTITPSTEMDDPEILSDDEELPNLPPNIIISPNNNHNHSQYQSINSNANNYGHNLSVDHIAYPPTMSFQ